MPGFGGFATRVQALYFSRTIPSTGETRPVAVGPRRRVRLGTTRDCTQPKPVQAIPLLTPSRQGPSEAIPVRLYSMSGGPS
jgi:hypothetical protein